MPLLVLSIQELRVSEKLEEHSVVILIDIGSTHDFLDPTLPQKGQVSVNAREQIEVRVANEEKLEGAELGAVQNSP